VALGRSKPGAVPFASTGSGSIPHLTIELLQADAQVKFLHVPYRGAAPAINDLLGGQVTVLCADTPVLLPQIRGGRLKALALASPSRNPALPGVPTMIEEGYANTIADNWYGLLAPAKTPPAVVAKLRDATAAALDASDVRARFTELGAVPSAMSSAEFGKFLADELARWGSVVKDKNIKED
jgi:tripartite-type tricarboxylate transporter receptor subunit TctC